MWKSFGSSEVVYRELLTWEGVNLIDSCIDP